MALYPKFINTSGVFNDADNADQQIIKLDFSNFIQKNNAVFDSEIYLKENTRINFNGKIQGDPYTTEDKDINLINQAKLANINHDGNNTTTINGTLDVSTSTVLFPDESIAINKVTSLTDTLIGIQTNLSNITSNDDDIINLDSLTTIHTNKIAAIELLNTEQTAVLDSITSDITNIISPSITANNTDIIANKNLIDINVNNIQNNLIPDIQTNVNNINLTQSNLDTTNSNVTTNLTAFTDFTISNTTELVLIDGKITNNTTNITALEGETDALNTLTSSHTTNLSSIEDNINIHASNLTALDNKTLTNLNNITNLSSTSATHTDNIFSINGIVTVNSLDIDTLQAQEITNNNDIDVLKNNILTKQPNITSTVRLQAAYLGNGDVSNDKLSSLNDIDVTKSIQTQLNTLTSSLDGLDALQDIDLINIPNIQSDLSTLTNTVSNNQTLNNSNFTTANNNINLKHDRITSLAKLDVSLLGNGDVTNNKLSSLNDIDVTKTIQTQLNTLTGSIAGLDALQDIDLINIPNLQNDLAATNINIVALQDNININTNDILTKQNVINSTNKLNSFFLDRTTSNLQYVDINTSLTSQLTNINNSLSTLSSLQNGDIASFNSIQDNFDILEGINTTQATTNIQLQTNIDNIDTTGNSGSSSKIEDLVSGSFVSNVLTYTYDESNIYMNQLIGSNVFNLNLAINTPLNNKTYVQKVIIDTLEFKGYVNVLNINNELVEIKHENGNLDINLSSIMGYSMIMQELNLTRVNNAWVCLSKIRLYYNSLSYKVYDVTAPVINLFDLNGALNIDHEINTVFSDPGAEAIDNIDGDVTANMTVVSNVNSSVLGSYTIVYSSSDSAGNTSTKTRHVNVRDTINPVVVLNGETLVELFVNAEYIELGATVTDNSNEVLTVVITGTIDTSTVGDYSLIYTATDSTGNVHDTISRTVSVSVDAIPLWSNSAINIFDKIGFLNMFRILSENWTYTVPTNYNSTVTNYINSDGVSEPFINGAYEFNVSSTRDYNNNTKQPAQLFNNNPMTASWEYYEGVNAGTDSNGYGTTQYTQYSQLADNGVTYLGQYFEFNFPFQFKFTKLYMGALGAGTNFIPLDYAILGTNNKIDYTLLETFSFAPNTTEEFTHNFTSSVGRYSGIKIVFTRVAPTGRGVLLSDCRFYGDIF